MLRFADPWYLLLLLFLPLLVLWYIRAGSGTSGKLKYSDIGLIKGIGQSMKQRVRHGLFLLKLTALALLIVALARPQSSSKEEEVITEGVDIILALDVSSSMRAEDFKPKNRLEAAKNVAREFIEGRVNDRIGMVVFAGQSFTQCPLTLDYGVLITLLEQIKIADENWDGTAIGMGLVNAVNRLRDSKARSKIVILLTDGENNAGQIDPVTAARIAQSFNVKIYTIGAGTRGTAMVPVDDPIFGRRYLPTQVNIDEDMLKNIAATTGGQYFRATDSEKLSEIYGQISEMEQTRIEVKEYTRYEELYIRYAGAGFLLLLIVLFLNNTYFRKVP